MGDGQGAEEREFFVSYTGVDLAWAEWVAWELEAAGYTTVLQDWDFVAGSNFADAMDRALKAARHLLAILSPAYLRSRYGKAEWLNAFIQDPTGEDRRLVPVRAEDCDPRGLLQGVVYIDLVGLDEATARERLLDQIAGALRGHRRPIDRPRFPTTPNKKAAVERPRFPTALPPIWNVPWRRNPDFTGREAQLAALAAQLDQGTAAITQAQAVHGTGGIGKTSLAVEYAYRHRATFEVVWWVRAEEPASLIGDYTALAAALRLPEADQPDQQAAAAAVRRWLDGNGRWLLVLDNAQAPEAPTGLRPPLARLVDLIPQVVNGQALVTTRDVRWERGASLAELDLFTAEEAVRFLLARAGSTDSKAAGQVAGLLGWLPLALEQAGAYSRETGIGLATYLERLQQFPELTLAKGEPRDRDPADTVAATWQVSLERVRPVPGALSLLEMCAFLASDDIPRELFATEVDGQPEELAAVAADPFALDEAVAALRRYSLAKAFQEVLVVHRLLQQVVRASLDPEPAADRAGLAVQLLAEAFPQGDLSDVQSWPVCERLLPHVLAAVQHAEERAAQPEATGWLLDSAATYLQGRGRFAEARSLFERALAVTEQTFGPEDQRTGTRLNNLGGLHLAVGDFSAAKAMLERSLAIRQVSDGSDSLGVATILHNLGRVLRDQGECDAARQYLQRAVTVREAALGPDHPSVAATLDNLGLVLKDLQEPEGARQYYLRALAIKEAALGPDHPEIATTLNNLGMVHQDLGELDAALQQYRRAVIIYETTLGPHHPYLAITLYNIGLVLKELGELDAAREFFMRALAICQAELQPDHPVIQGIMRNLADLGEG